ncbi:hypothetical protein EIN_269580 [Entamoeba invadens IP1]|uniref:Uncharacterized protein n=1 Tax=Entamoeba invadens IP1 TaxID=370355 RepID=A0A0A1UBR5_ENTIV|nr:hypothetical protein EIN_269580 [Entamoeba invadens IP1]ELP91122.1 hypothetical protein EIN_269580 [Entamoeba invadens IP1]|eukprot:XP_004257893.1 hypothetical protein EIN_269580 [Entamoeba invadens IP1]
MEYYYKLRIVDISSNHFIICRQNRESEKKNQCVRERTMISNLQCALLAFIATKAEIELTKQKKQSKLSREFLCVNFINFSEELYTFDVKKYVKIRLNEKLNLFIKNGFNATTAHRKVVNEKKREVLHLLEDILFNEGFVVYYENENREGIRGNVFIQMPDGRIIERDMIINLGTKIWNDFNIVWTKKVGDIGTQIQWLKGGLPSKNTRGNYFFGKRGEGGKGRYRLYIQNY